MITKDQFKPGSMHLIFQDGTRLEFSLEEIHMHGNMFFSDPACVPEEIKKAADYQRCEVCPQRHTQGHCHALLPVVSFIETIDKYPSYEPVVAIYHDEFLDNLIVKETTLQFALQYISILSLIHYCELGREYRDLFHMVSPIMDPQNVAARIYLNAFWLFKGDKERINQYLRKFGNEMHVTIECQVKRLKMISKNDAFINAYVLTHVLTNLLEVNPEDSMALLLGEYRKKLA